MIIPRRVCFVINRTLREKKYWRQKFFSYYYRWNYSAATKLHSNINRSFSTGNYESYFSKTTCLHKAVGPEDKTLSTKHTDIQKFPTVGVVFDIDGVLVRGRNVINSAKKAISKLVTHKIPFAYLTNGGCETEQQKAQALEKLLGIIIDPDQVILSHSPLRILDILHDKHVLVCGQGPVSEIAEMCGFSKVCHVDDIDCHFPELDVNDKRKRDRIPYPCRKPFAPIEAIVLMGEPVNWEKSLQIIIDIILTNHGIPNSKYSKLTEQIPIVAINTDYLWMSECVNPRLGHGAFLLCLESLFQKLTGKTLEYTTVLGKPNLFTYCYTEGVLLNLAQKMFGKNTRIKTIYAVGDNPDTDIFGANVYNSYLKAIQGSDIITDPLHPNSSTQPERMKSILVKTGVYGSDSCGAWEDDVNHLHRDTMYRPEFSLPTHTCVDVFEAVETILKEEGLE